MTKQRVILTRRDAVKSAAVLGGAASIIGGTATATGEPTSLNLVGHSLLGNPDGGFAEGDQREDLGLAAVGSFLTDNGTYIVDVSDPANPRRVDHVPLADTRCADVKFDPERELVYRSNEWNNGDGRNGFDVLETDADGNWVEAHHHSIDMFSADHGVHNITPIVRNGRTYLVLSFSVGGDPLVVVDVTDPATPVEVETYQDGSDNIHDVTIRGDLGFVAHWDAGLRIVDVSDPESIDEVAAFDYRSRDYENAHFARAHPSDDLVVLGDEIGTGDPGPKHAIWFDADAGTTKELSTFRAPQENARQPTGHQAFWWTGHNFDFGGPGDSLLFSGDYKAGVQVFDLSDPSDPVRIDKHYPNEEIDRVRSEDTGGFVDAVPFTWGAKVQDGRIYATDMQTGLYVFEWG